MFAVLHVSDFSLHAILRAEPRAGANAGAGPDAHPGGAGADGGADSRGREREREREREPGSAGGPPSALLDPATRPARVLAVNASARARGVEPGQTSAQALARCPALRVLTPRPEAEAEARAGLLAAAFALSPQVEDTAPGVCTVRLDGLAEAGREPALRRALARLAELGLPATAGAGATPLLALYAARRAEPLLMVGRGRAFLAALPLAAADPPPELAAILAGWGVRTLGELTDLPKSAIAQRLGPAGLALWERAAGQAERPLRVLAPSPSFTASLGFEHELETLEPLLFVVRRFIDRLALELQNASLAAAGIVFTLTLADDTELRRVLRLPEPSARADLLFGALQSHLATLRAPAAVTGLRLELTPARVTARQPGFFERSLRDPHRFAETLARVAALVGDDRVGTPVRQNTHRPDAFALTAPADEIGPPAPGVFRHPPRGLVLRRYRPARPVAVETDPVSKQPLSLRALDRPPAAGGAGPREGTRRLAGEPEERIQAVAGPWRASGDWWQADQNWWREEWDIQLEHGALHRLSRGPDGWRLDGEYD